MMDESRIIFLVPGSSLQLLISLKKHICFPFFVSNPKRDGWFPLLKTAIFNFFILCEKYWQNPTFSTGLTKLFVRNLCTLGSSLKCSFVNSRFCCPPSCITKLILNSQDCRPEITFHFIIYSPDSFTPSVK